MENNGDSNNSTAPCMQTASKKLPCMRVIMNDS